MFSRYGANNLTLLIMNYLTIQKDLKQEDIVSKLVCFGVDGVNAFQGLKSKVPI
jgi:hypothetical protein